MHTHGRLLPSIAVIIGTASVIVAAPSVADDAAAGRRQDCITAAAARADQLWREIATGDPPPTLRSRDLFTASLALAEVRRHPERVARFLELGAAMQDRDPASPHAGNFRWSWDDAGVTDANAVEFCSFDMHLLWRRHRDWLPEPTRRVLRGLLDRAVDGCLTHAVRPSYTNIAILNAANLITLGEAIARLDAADEGYRRLEACAAETWQWGLHEFCSPAYYAIDIRGLSVIEACAGRDAGRDLARAMLELVWTDIAVNFLPAAGRLAGPHSRTYDALHGRGGLQQDLRRQGWIDVPVAMSLDVIDVAQGEWSPPAPLLELARTRFPRLVRQAWGPAYAESRTHWLRDDVSLGCAHAGYGDHDARLTFDFPGPPGTVRGSFVPDGRDDPYGQRKQAAGAAGHMKALHLTPFWAAAQRTSDALGLVIYRQSDLANDDLVTLRSHVILPRDVDGIWLGGRRLELPHAASMPPPSFPIAAGESLVIREESAAVGLRVVWARGQDGLPAAATLVDDGRALGALRLTIDHRQASPATEAAAAIWVRAGGGLRDDDEFIAWQTQFERAAPAAVAATADSISLSVPGSDGPVSITAHAPFTSAARLDLEPTPSRAVLELDGIDIGRPLLERTPLGAALAARAAAAMPHDLPKKGGIRIEAEEGIVMPRMLSGDESGRRFIWQPDGLPPAFASGSTTWRLRVPQAGRYWLWGRALAPDSRRDSFRVAVTSPDDHVILAGDWHLRRGGDWQWSPVVVDESGDMAPLDLAVGEVRLTISSRERGTKLDALWLSTDRDDHPRD